MIRIVFVTLIALAALVIALAIGLHATFTGIPAGPFIVVISVIGLIALAAGSGIFRR